MLMETFSQLNWFVIFVFVLCIDFHKNILEMKWRSVPEQPATKQLHKYDMNGILSVV